jgi:hypothetical protein
VGYVVRFQVNAVVRMVTIHNQHIVRERGETTGNGSGVGMTLLVLLFPEVVELICDGESERMDDGVLEKVAVPFV